MGAKKKANTSKVETNKKSIIEYIKNHKEGCIVIAAFFMFLIYQMKFIVETNFDPDELDIFTVGFEMFKGKVLYRDIPSQHMPWTYILSAFFHLLGAHTTETQRFCFYVFFAAFWASFIYIYREYVNKWVLILQPFLLFALLQNGDFMTQILSEHVAIIGGEIFLLEFIVFLHKKDLSIGSCIRLSIATVLLFGTMFVNIYPIFFIGLAVLIMEIVWGFQRHDTFGKWFKMMLIRYGKLLGFVLIPWVCLAIYCLATHSLYSMYQGTFAVNMVSYSQYYSGIETGAVGTFVVGPTRFSQYIMTHTYEDINPLTLVKTFNVGCAIYMGYRFGRKHGIVPGIIIPVYVYTFGVRGFFGYHAVAYVGVSCLVAAYVMVTYMFEDWKTYDKKSILTKVSLGVVVTIYIAMLSYNLNAIANFLFFRVGNNYEDDTKAVLAITDEDERIWQTTTVNSIPWNTLRVTKGPTVSTPWMWDYFGSKQMADYEKDPARVVMFQIGYECWDHNMADYAPEAYYYIVNNYKYLPGTTQIWVQNDYYDEACAKLGIDASVENDNGISRSPYNVEPTEMPGMTYEDRKSAVEGQE